MGVEGGQTRRMDTNGESEMRGRRRRRRRRSGRASRGQVGPLGFRRRARRKEGNLSVCKRGDTSSPSIIPLYTFSFRACTLPPSHTRTHTHVSHTRRQPDGAVCKACPIKLHPLVKKMYGRGAKPQTRGHAHLQQHNCSCTHTHMRSHTRIHTQIFIILFISLLRQLQDAASPPSACPLGPPLFSFSLSPFWFFIATPLSR